MRPAVLICLCAAALAAADPAAIPIWPNDPAPDRSVSRIGPNDQTRRISNVTRPTLAPFLPSGASARAAFVILPGGGFRHLSIDKEGSDVARWLNGLGIAGFVVQYRVRDDDRETAKRLGAEDAQEAIRIVRSRASEWGLDPRRVGVIGFSAGGYHAVRAALQFTEANRPDLVAAIYPAAPESLEFPAGAPPTFLVHADDDRLTPAANSVPIYLALKKAGVPAEMHIFSKGGHGFGMDKRNLPTDAWTARFAEWLAAMNWITPRASLPR